MDNDVNMTNDLNMTNDNHDSMCIEISRDIDYGNSNENVTMYDDFLDSIDKSIISGDITYIEKSLKTYGNSLNHESIKVASDIILQILGEKMEDIL